MNAPAELNSAPLTDDDEIFVTVPETTLPNGTVVPAFQVARYIASQGDDGKATHGVSLKPWVNINFHDAKLASSSAGYQLITETQWLAIAHQITQQGENWTTGTVGEGELYRGLHKGTYNGALAANIESKDPLERRWHVLSNGERVYDFSGNVFQWVFDDVQGNPDGLTGIIKADSISLKTAPVNSMEKGVGWYPDGERDWSGYALVRGGCWLSVGYAGVFRLRGVWPGNGVNRVGFRCTKSL